MKLGPLSTLFLIIALLTGVCEAGVVKELNFVKGSNSTLIEGGVIRGERDQYFLTAKAGQKMEVSITAVEKNAAFSIYQPGFKTSKGEYGILEVAGVTLPGTGESDDATAWKGVLPISGKYLIVVGGTRGNATYQLKITIR